MLDNADGQLARLTGRVTAFGRYLDSEFDLLVDAALFAGARVVHGPAGRSRRSGSSRSLLVLSINFNVERLRARRAPAAWDAVGRCGAARLRLVYGSQDRLVERFVERGCAAHRAERLAYHDRRRSPCSRTWGCRRSSRSSASASRPGRPLASWIVVASSLLVQRSSFVETGASVSRRDFIESRRCRLNIVELPARPEPDGERAIDAGGVGALRAQRRRDPHRVRHGSRHARNARDAAPFSPGACSTRRRVTTATRSCAPPSRPSGRRASTGAHSQIVEGPIAFFSLCEHHALPFHGVGARRVRRRRRDPRHLEADSARPALRAPLHRAGTARRADRGRDSSSSSNRVASRCTSRPLTSARRCAAWRRKDSRTVTTFWRGLYDEDADLRREFLDQVRAHRSR